VVYYSENVFALLIKKLTSKKKNLEKKFTKILAKKKNQKIDKNYM